MASYIKLLLFAWLIGQSVAREITSAKSQIKKVDVLGFPTAIDVLEVEFDEPLLLAKTYGACQNKTCASVPSCICDYTSADVCSGKAPNGCNCPVGLTCAINTTLQLGVPFSDYVAPGETNNYKIYIGSQHACKFIHFDLVAENGDPDIYVGTAATFDAGGSLGTPNGLPRVQGKYGPESMILCPSDFSAFELGTLVIGIYSFPSGNIAQGVGAKVTVTVTAHDIPPAITALPCTPEHANHTCIVDDEWVFETTTQTKNYEMALPNECTTISFLTGIETFIGFSYDPFPELKFESKLFTGGMETGGTIQKGAFVICPQDLGINKIYIAANATRASSKGFSFIVSTNPGWFHTQPIDSFNNFQYPFEVLSSAYMQCPNNQSFSCFERLSNGVDCYYFWFVNPVADPAPFYPRPLFTRGIPNINGIELSDKPSNPLANKFVAVVMLNLTVSLQSRFRIAEADLMNCQMKFSGRLLWSSNKQPVQETVTFTPTAEECDFAELDATVARMNKLLADQESVTTGLDLSNIRYQLDTYAAGRNVYNCKQFALGFSSRAVTNVTLDTKACLVTSSSPLFASDPCCNTSIGWTAENCNPRSQTVPLEVFSDITAATDQCYAPRCLSIFAQNFAKKSLTVADTLVGCSSNTPNALNFRADLYEPYQRCKEEVFGVLPAQGFPCWSDSDCEGSTKCDLVHNKCLYPMSDRIDLFLHCFLDDINPFIRDYIEKDQGIQTALDVGDEANFQQWKTAFTVNDCASEYDLAIKYRHRWKLIPSFSTFVCPLCPEYACLDKSCTVPFECNNIGGSCGKVWQAFPAQSCNLLQYCNWINCEDLSTNTNSTCKSACLDPVQSADFCGVCENGQDCVELTSLTTEPECTSAQACVKHDSSVIVVNSEAQCSNSLSCSVTCFDGTNDVPCNDENSCTTAGVCDGDYYVGNGACVKPLNPYNTPACKAPSWAQPYGCVDTTINQTACESGGGVWRKKARTEDECNAFGYGCTERRIVSTWNNRYFITMKGPEACAAVGGVYGPILKWRSGTYQGGIIRTPTWQARAYTSRYSATPTFDFFNLNEGINAAVNVKYSYNLKTENQCMYAQQVQLLDIVTCGCSPSGDLSEQCFSDYDPSITDALTIVCQAVGGTISDVDTKIAVTYGNSSLESSSLCISLKTGYTSVEKFKFSALNAISTFLINFNSKEDYTFVNTNNAVVGGFIGDGISFDFEGGTLRNFTICVPVVNNSIAKNTERFPVRDIALVDIGTNNVTPLQVEVTESQGKLCGTVAQLVSPSLNNSYAYFPIARQANYATIKRQVNFLDHELALIIICIILYAFCAAFTLVKAIMIMRLGKWTQLTYLVLLILCGLCIVRLLFFLLTVGGAVFSAGDYVIIELPSFLYFSALSFFVIIWMFVARVIRRPNVSRNRINQTITRYVIITNAVIYTIFILLIILYEALKQDVPVCGGRLQNFDLNTRQQIAYTYRLFVSAISLILGLGFIIYGFTVYSNMLSSRAKGEKGKSRISGRKRVFWTTFICSVGLLCQCAFLLALLFSNYQNNTLAMGLLIAVEVIPITIVAAVTKTTDSETSYGTTTSPNTSGTKGAKMSTIKNSALSVRSDRMDDTSKTTTADVPGARDPVASAATDNSKEIQTGDTNDEDSDNDMYPSSADPESSTSESEASKSEAGEQKNEEDSEQESASQASEPSKKELN